MTIKQGSNNNNSLNTRCILPFCPARSLALLRIKHVNICQIGIFRLHLLQIHRSCVIQSASPALVRVPLSSLGDRTYREQQSMLVLALVACSLLGACGGEQFTHGGFVIIWQLVFSQFRSTFVEHRCVDSPCTRTASVSVLHQAS